MTNIKTAIVYTDGACLGNPGPGGWAAVILRGGQEQRLSGGCHYTTNNQMELTGVIRALEELSKEGSMEVTIISDSQYVCNAFNQHWIDNWRRCEWTRSGDPLKNADMWKALDALVSKHLCTFKWVKGHAGNKYNEICDQLSGIEARKAAGNWDEREEPYQSLDVPEDPQQSLFGAAKPAEDSGVIRELEAKLADSEAESEALAAKLQSIEGQLANKAELVSQQAAELEKRDKLLKEQEAELDASRAETASLLQAMEKYIRGMNQAMLGIETPCGELEYCAGCKNGSCAGAFVAHAISSLKEAK